MRLQSSHFHALMRKQQLHQKWPLKTGQRAGTCHAGGLPMRMTSRASCSCLILLNPWRFWSLRANSSRLRCWTNKAGPAPHSAPVTVKLLQTVSRAWARCECTGAIQRHAVQVQVHAHAWRFNSLPH